MYLAYPVYTQHDHNVLSCLWGYSRGKKIEVMQINILKGYPKFEEILKQFGQS